MKRKDLEDVLRRHFGSDKYDMMMGKKGMILVSVAKEMAYDMFLYPPKDTDKKADARLLRNALIRLQTTESWGFTE